jgi:hypothetical protein
VVFLLLFNDISFALSPEPGTQKAIVKCEYQVLSWMRSGRLKFAENDEDIRFLKEANHADALLLSHGKILADKSLKKDPLQLVRKINHEEIEAILQIMAREDRSKYSALINIVLSRSAIREKYYDLFSEDRRPNLPDELLANDILAKAFELLIPEMNGLVENGQIASAESEFLKTIEPIINANKHNYFTGVFWDDSVREAKIRVAMANGMKFAQVASMEPKATAPLVQVASVESKATASTEKQDVPIIPLATGAVTRARPETVTAEIETGSRTVKLRINYSPVLKNNSKLWHRWMTKSPDPIAYTQEVGLQPAYMGVSGDFNALVMEFARQLVLTGLLWKRSIKEDELFTIRNNFIKAYTGKAALLDIALGLKAQAIIDELIRKMPEKNP